MLFKRMLFFLFAAFLVVGFSGGAVQADPGIPDTVRVESVQVNAGDHFGLDIFVYNDESLSGGTLGFRWGTPDLRVDSVIYDGGILDHIAPGQRPVTIDNVTNYEVLTGFFIIFDAPVPAGVGKWATIWITADPGAADQIIPFDSVKVEPSGDFVLIALAGNASIKPQFEIGAITIGDPQANTAPTLATIGPKGVAEGVNLNFETSASDAESIPTHSAVGLPPGASYIDAADGTATFDWTPGFDAAGPYNVTFIASDGELADSELVVITVTNTNRAPNWAAVTPQEVDENANLTYGVSATDPDSDPLTLSAISTPTNGSFSDDGGGNGTVTFDPDFTQAGVHNFVLVANDGDLADTVTVQVTVTNVNRAPVWAAVTPQVVDEGGNLTYGVSATDPDGNPLTLSDLSSPTNGSFSDDGGGNGTVTFNPDFTQAGIHNFILEASDGDLTDTVGVQVTVSNVNQAPALAAIADTTISVGQALSINASATDPDGDSILLVIDGLPATNATFTDNGDGTALFSFTPDVSQANTVFALAVTASDADTAVSESFDVTVGPPDEPDSAFIAPDSLFFSMVQGDGSNDTGCVTLISTNSPANYTLNVLDISPRGAGADTAHIFVQLLNPQGQTDESVCVAVTENGRLPGLYYNTVQATVEGVDNNPVDFVVCLTVEAAPIPDSASVSPDTLWFTAVEGEETVQVGCAFLSSTNAPAFYTAANDTDNVFASAVAGSGETNDSVCVSVASSALVPGTYYDHVRYTVTGVDNNPQTLVLCLTVEPVQVSHTATVTPDTLFFTVTEGDNSGSTGCANVNSTNAPASYTAGATGDPFFTDLFSSGGTTNDSICLQVVNTGSLSPGVYYNDVTINVDGVDNNPVGFIVCLTVEEVVVVDTSILAISNNTFLFEASVDSATILGDSLIISNVGSGPDFSWSIEKIVSWSIDTSGDTTIDTSNAIPDGLSVSPLAGATPGVVFISLDTEGMAAGEYYYQMAVVAEIGVQNSPQFFEIFLTIHPGIPPVVSILEVSDSVFTYFANAGEANTVADTVDIFKLGDGPEIDWELGVGFCYYISPDLIDTIQLPEALFDFGSVGGTTPSSLTFSFATDTLPVGDYWCDFAIIATDSAVLNSPRIIQAHLTVNPVFVPSGDTIWVSTVPGTPGSKVKVPVNMTNQGPICGLQVLLEWGSAQIFLDSISFEGTRLEGLAITESSFENGDRVLGITFNAESFAMPAGTGKIANLYFDIFSGITDGGVVPITLDSRLFCPQCNPSADNCTDEFFPEFFPGGIVIDSSASVICGRVVDTAGNEINGAIVEVWDFFPQGSWFAADTTTGAGAFKFTELFVTPYTLYAYANGYYPATLEDINFGSLGLEIVLTPVSSVNPTNEWVDFYCDFNTYMGLPLPVGFVIDAFDPDGDHVGTWTVTEEGKYGFMPIYRDDPFTPEDDGAEPGDTITLYINGMPAEFSGDRVWTQNGDHFEVCVDYDGSVDKSFCLSDGWHLISWSVDSEIDDVEALFAPIMSNIDVILSFEEVGLTYDPDLPEFSTLTSADHLHGYWIHIENAGECVEWNVSGTPVLVNTPMALEEGWNLVSYLPPVSLPTSSALVSQEGNLRVALGYDNGGQTFDPLLPDFSTLPEMHPCFGYWLKVFAPSELVYPGFNSVPYIQPDETAPETLSPLAKLGVADDLRPTNEWVNLYSKDLTVDGEQVAGGVSVRALNAAGDLIGYGVTERAGLLRFTPVYGSSSEESAGLKVGEEFTLEIDGQEIAESFTYTERGARIELAALTSTGVGAVLPSEFALAQNYPNPFNPKTNITFQLPHDAVVTLEVFNLLGEKIATLADGPYGAGETTVSWEAKDASGKAVASGVYFYRLKAGENVQTRKMVLLK